ERADALLFGRVTYEMMEAAFRLPAATGAMPAWMEPFARTIDAAKKYVVSSTLARVDWNAELVRGELDKAVQRFKRESTRGLFVGFTFERLPFFEVRTWWWNERPKSSKRPVTRMMRPLAGPVLVARGRSSRPPATRRP